MLANAMFYGQAVSSTNVIAIGPFAMSPEQVDFFYTGMYGV